MTPIKISINQDYPFYNGIRIYGLYKWSWDYYRWVLDEDYFNKMNKNITND